MIGWIRVISQTDALPVEHLALKGTATEEEDGLRRSLKLPHTTSTIIIKAVYYFLNYSFEPSETVHAELKRTADSAD